MVYYIIGIVTFYVIAALEVKQRKVKI